MYNVVEKTFMHLIVTYGQFMYMSFGSELVVARFNKRKEKVDKLTGIN